MAQNSLLERQAREVANGARLFENATVDENLSTIVEKSLLEGQAREVAYGARLFMNITPETEAQVQRAVRAWLQFCYPWATFQKPSFARRVSWLQLTRTCQINLTRRFSRARVEKEAAIFPLLRKKR